MKRCYLSICLSLVIGSFLIAQVQSIEGRIYDANTQVPLPYANIQKSGTLEGTLSDSTGYFRLTTDQNRVTVVISFLGYKTDTLVISDPQSEIIDIPLQQWTYGLEEIIVSPKSPEELIKEAVEKYPQNVTDQPFMTQSYFSADQIFRADQKEQIERDEAAFLTYYTHYSDESVRGMSKLLLHRYSSNNDTVDLSMIKNTKVNKKISKIQEKEKYQQDVEYSNAFVSGNGPDFVLKELYQQSTLPFLDERNFSRIRFYFLPPTYYNEKDVFVIGFETIEPIDIYTYQGKIYLETQSLAIVSINYVEEIKIPLVLKPIIKATTGIGMHRIENIVDLHNQSQKDKWYPKKVLFRSVLTVKENKPFQKKKLLEIEKNHLLSIDKVITEGIQPFPKKEIYRSDKDYAEQVRSNHDLHWDDVNVIHRALPQGK